jgi:hypothetical protein
MQFRRKKGRRKKEEGTRRKKKEENNPNQLPITNYQLPITETWKIPPKIHRRKYKPICT